MATITLELNDDLVDRLNNVGDQLPQLLNYALNMAGIPGGNLPANPDTLAWLEAIDFLANSPSPKQIVEFKVSPTAQERLEDLLDGQRSNDLTPTEKAELETYRQVNHLFIILKARVRGILDQN